MVVDDIDINRMILEAILSGDYVVEQAENGADAVDMLLSGKCRPSLVLLDINMPEMDGFEVLQVIKNNEATRHIPVIFITAADPSENELRGLRGGAIDYIAKPFNHDIVKLRVSAHVELVQYRAHLEDMVEQKVNQLIAGKENMLAAMAAIVEEKNLESGEHIKRTTRLTGIFAEELLKKPEFMTELKAMDYRIMVKASPLHDIGKLLIPDDVLLKPGKYTPEEFAVMETHTSKGSDIIEKLLQDESADEKDNLYLRHCYDICRYHHERWDGRGYPDRIAGEAIPLSARIVSVIDVYDALVSKRVYKDAIAHEDALEIIKEETAGGKFDARIVEVLLESAHLLKEVYGA